MRGKLHSLRVVKTRLGRGVVTRQRLRPNEVIGLFRGRIIEDPYYDSRYCIELDERRVMEPYPPLRFLNHCCRPNCHIVSHEDADVDPWFADRLWLQALTWIEPGDELTIDYAMIDGDPDERMDCSCGKPECRQVITGNDWRRAELRERYAGYFSRYLRDRIHAGGAGQRVE